MASDRQTAANRLNATQSTGPRTDEGKRRSRRNAIRHGLTAETIVTILEDPAVYEAFEAEIQAHYEPRTSAESELAVRLASLFWRLRRATRIESGLLEIHAGALAKRKVIDQETPKPSNEKLSIFYKLLAPPGIVPSPHIEPSRQIDESENALGQHRDAASITKIARSFSHLVHRDSGAFDRLGRYEASLSRQILQTMILLDLIKERRSRQTIYRSGIARRRRPRYFPMHFYK